MIYEPPRTSCLYVLVLYMTITTCYLLKMTPSKGGSPMHKVGDTVGTGKYTVRRDEKGERTEKDLGPQQLEKTCPYVQWKEQSLTKLNKRKRFM